MSCHSIISTSALFISKSSSTIFSGCLFPRTSRLCVQIRILSDFFLWLKKLFPLKGYLSINLLVWLL